MGITPIEIKEYRLRTSMFGGNNKRDVAELMELAADALAETQKELTGLREKLKLTAMKLAEHEKREAVLKDTITTAQKMVDSLKSNAQKEAELIIAEARHRGDEIFQQAQRRALEIQGEIQGLKRQRLELETSLKGVLEYHHGLLDMEKKQAATKDTDADKLKLFPNK